MESDSLWRESVLVLVGAPRACECRRRFSVVKDDCFFDRMVTGGPVGDSGCGDDVPASTEALVSALLPSGTTTGESRVWSLTFEMSVELSLSCDEATLPTLAYRSFTMSVWLSEPVMVDSPSAELPVSEGPVSLALSPRSTTTISVSRKAVMGADAASKTWGGISSSPSNEV